MIGTYTLIKDFNAPAVIVNLHLKRPTEVCYKKFKKGDMIQGELKHVNNKPAIVIVRGQLVFPVSVLRAVVTKEIISDASGETKKPATIETVLPKAKTQKIQYLDAAIIGALAGAGIVYVAERKGWMPPATDHKNKVYGAIVGALAAFYILYRRNQNKMVKTKEKE